MDITRDAAIGLFAALGVKNAHNWSPKRLVTRLGKVNEMVDEDTKLEGEMGTVLTCVQIAIEDEDPIVLTKVKPPTKKKKAATPPKEKAPSKEKAAIICYLPSGRKPTPAKKKAAAKPAKEKAATKPPAKKKAAAKPAKPTAHDGERFPGVRMGRTRSFLAGVLIKKYGMNAGVTEDMVEELDELCGKRNPVESRISLRNAWHVIRGFRDGDSE